MSENYIVVGVGSNLGRPIENLRKSLRKLKKLGPVIKVSSIYESEALLQPTAPQNWQLSYLNAAVLLKLNTFEPIDFLKELKKIENECGIRSTDKWAPRHLDLDILYWEKNKAPQFYDIPNLKIPHLELTHRPFALLPLLEIFPHAQIEKPVWLSQKKVIPFNTKISSKYYWPKLMGIINLTPDSFSDGNEELNSNIVSEQIEKLMDNGADILDFGAQSTRPGSVQLSAEQEWLRISEYLPTIQFYQRKRNFELSLDTYQASVAEKFFSQLPWDYLNDVHGLNDSQMMELLKKTGKKAIVMHSLGVPPTKEKVLNPFSNPMLQLVDWWQRHCQNLMELGLNKDQLIFDPGIGFGKTSTQCFYILQNLEQFYPIQGEILIGHSRKSFLGQLTDKLAKDRDPETALVTQDLNQAYVQYLRLHDLASQKPALRKEF